MGRTPTKFRWLRWPQPAAAAQDGCPSSPACAGRARRPAPPRTTVPRSGLPQAAGARRPAAAPALKAQRQPAHTPPPVTHRTSRPPAGRAPPRPCAEPCRATARRAGARPTADSAQRRPANSRRRRRHSRRCTPKFRSSAGRRQTGRQTARSRTY